MQFILSLIFASYRAHFILAALLAVGGFVIYGLDVRKDALRVEIAAQPQPSVQPIEAFRRGEGRPSVEEVHVRAQIVPSQSILLRKTEESGDVSNESVLYLLYQASADAENARETESLVAYGGVVVPFSQTDMFIDWVRSRQLSDGPLGPIVDLEGFWKSGSSESAARNGMEKFATATSRDFFYIQPFYKGRAAGVAYTPRDMAAERISYFYPAFAFLAFGMLKLLWAMARANKTARKPEEKAVVTVQPLMPEPDIPKPLAANDFIGAISARKASASVEQAAPTAVRHGMAGRFGGSIGRGLKKVGFAIAALVLYLTIANFGSMSGEPEMIMLTEAVGAQAVQEQSVLPNEAALQGQTARWQQMLQSKAKAHISLGVVSVPFWMFAVLLLGAVLVVYVLRHVGQKTMRGTQFDPFDRLLQRRQAEKAREAQGSMLGRTALRA